jgi:pantoate--beta-alanine ligase
MYTIQTLQNLKETIKRWKQAGLTIGFVPTMGNLHAGHLTLVTAAKAKADKVVVSIFVNPTQFGVGEDFDSYPRTEQDDAQQLLAHGVDVLFLPSVAEMYDDKAKTVISVQGLSMLHCGQSRVGHFDGVATVVCKLFNRVQPDYAFFGEKDFQQLAIIRTMVRDLDIPVDVYAVPTVRASDGLAMSSRNGYLTAEQRAIAPILYQTLCAAQAAILNGQRDFAAIEHQQKQVLQAAGFEVDYFSICCAEDLLPAKATDNTLVIVAAARLGKPRLIDNIQFKIKAVTVDSLA